ncbi:hypothetical protein VNO77_43953 [Canavalia gladiata]|uniref:Uncharacterized protein n=1 Tax=Canavalia gladiata TaxID=3824 RepID=A0AAN9JYR0_CANGL
MISGIIHHGNYISLFNLFFGTNQSLSTAYGSRTIQRELVTKRMKVRCIVFDLAAMINCAAMTKGHSLFPTSLGGGGPTVNYAPIKPVNIPKVWLPSRDVLSSLKSTTHSQAFHLGFSSIQTQGPLTSILPAVSPQTSKAIQQTISLLYGVGRTTFNSPTEPPNKDLDSCSILHAYFNRTVDNDFYKLHLPSHRIKGRLNLDSINAYRFYHQQLTLDNRKQPARPLCFGTRLESGTKHEPATLTTNEDCL